MLETLNWSSLTHEGASTLAAFSASLVEFVEALTIVLAVGVSRGWRSALAGTGAGLVLLTVLVLIFGPLLSHIPVPVAWLQMTIGALLLIFGLRWLRKAILRASGLIPLHDEARLYQEEVRQMKQIGQTKGRWDSIALVTSFKAVVLEGIEVVFIVVAVGATETSLLPASVGAAAALLLVALLGIMLHRPLTRVPENSLKLAVGVILSAFGLFWIGEGLGLTWPGGDVVILGFIAGLLTIALFAVGLLQKQQRRNDRT